MAIKSKRKKVKIDIYTKYRCILKMPNLTKEKINDMRSHLNPIAQTICEHVWGKKFY
jgi:hypothetical protein